jgi:hypothetical protein
MLLLLQNIPFLHVIVLASISLLVNWHGFFQEGRVFEGA